MLYIWRLRFTAPRAWVVILGFFILSHILRGERTAGLGLRMRGARAAAAGAVGLLAYCPWGIFQQYLLNGCWRWPPLGASR